MQTKVRPAATGQNAAEDPLRRVPLFAEMDDAGHQALLEIGKCETFSPGDVFCREGDRLSKLFIILSGTVRIQRAAKDSEPPAYVGDRGAGDYFGIEGFLDDAPAAADAQATAGGEVLVLEREELKRAVAQKPDFAWSVLRGLARRLHDATEQSRRHRNLDVMGRLAAFLGDTAERMVPDANGERRLANLTDDQIAVQIHTSRESVNRKISRLKEMRIVRRDGRTLIVLNIPRLRALSGGE
ncbi:MAG TPA: Crp/Fnr family transcriptional regulator [Armatimonadaceae bacterium]|jgi:CRP-like cAMP-binding protein|nr:Crp/Fnr family transcriptional regulator [Armatimonadaceae bacterium]